MIRSWRKWPGEHTCVDIFFSQEKLLAVSFRRKNERVLFCLLLMQVVFVSDKIPLCSIPSATHKLAPDVPLRSVGHGAKRRASFTPRDNRGAIENSQLVFS